ncbi:4-diphosphocytidyl-2-C-methyl-D-erythritol kinase [subsurface metagenome]
MICFPNAKINIGLDIIEKRTDGYHNLESLFYPIALTDILEIVEGGERKGLGIQSFKVTGIKIPEPVEKNLCFQAHKLIKNDFDLPPLQIHLHKTIPTGSGLGGGSSDAAFTIKLINKLFRLQLSDQKMLEYAEKLGSDCPFFIYNVASLATGKGNKLTPISINLEKYYLVLVYPNIQIKSSIAYQYIIPGQKAKSISDLVSLKVQKWKGMVGNDFEGPVFRLYPEIARIKEKLYRLGALYCSMSGSGSAVYGIFNSKIDTKKIFPDYFVWQEKL